jgi:hypothetical protein
MNNMEVDFIIGLSDELSHLGGRQDYDWIIAKLWQYKQAVILGVL